MKTFTIFYLLVPLVYINSETFSSGIISDTIITDTDINNEFSSDIDALSDIDEDEEKIPFSYSEENPNRKTLEKYGTIRVPFDDYMISFDSSGFDDGEEMYFKIRAENDSYIDDGIYYQYIDQNVAFVVGEGKFVNYEIKTDFDTIGIKTYKIKYFTIKKNKAEFRGANGNLLIIEFYFDHGYIEITNTEEDEGKFETWKIVVIVVAVVIVFGIGIGCYCYRRKKQLAAAGQNTQIVQNVNINQQNPQQVDVIDAGVQQTNQPISKYEGGVE